MSCASVTRAVGGSTGEIIVCNPSGRIPLEVGEARGAYAEMGIEELTDVDGYKNPCGIRMSYAFARVGMHLIQGIDNTKFHYLHYR